MRWFNKMDYKHYALGWVAVLFSLAGAAFADTDEGWQIRKDEQGITVYAREVADSPIDEIRASASIQAPYPVVLALLLDHTARPQWNALCQEARVLQSGTPDEQRVYFYYKMPWPVTDRDLVMALSVNDADGVAIMRGTAIADDTAPAGSKAVRVLKAREEWRIERLDENSTRVTMTALMDPAGPIPAWLINAMSVSQPYEAMEQLRLLASQRAVAATAQIKK